MEALTKDEMDAIAEALAKQRKEESFERSLGRALRRRDLGYETYIHVVSELRGTARRKKVKVEEAAQMMLENSQKKGQHQAEQ